VKTCFTLNACETLHSVQGMVWIADLITEELLNCLPNTISSTFVDMVLDKQSRNLSFFFFQHLLICITSYLLFVLYNSLMIVVFNPQHVAKAL